MKLRRIVISLAAITFLASLPAFADRCENLSSLTLPDARVTSAQLIAAGAFTAAASPGNPVNAAMFKNLPAFCRVVAEVKPTSDSDIKVEVWMPVTGFNGNFRAVGNGGFAGSIGYSGMAAALAGGYASASTDTGHSASAIDGSWALGHPEKIVDFGYRAIHEMTVKAKAVIQAFYGQPAQHSFFSGCSNGGRQGLMEAQRFPADYDGILVGAPANYWTQVFTAFIWDIQALQTDPESYIPAKKIPAISAAVLAACDLDDGLKDGILSDPPACHFDPATIACKDADADSCLTSKQVAALKKVYTGPRDAAGKQLFPGFEPGGETGNGGWPLWITGQASGRDLQTVFADGFFKNMITSATPIDLRTINVQAAVKLADDQQARNFNADDPNLAPFMKHGGKLILYHGWSDAALPPIATANYLRSVEHALGQKSADGFLRLYFVPGVQHCAGGPGPDSFGQFGDPTTPDDAEHNLQLALEQWVEKGTPPEAVIATKYANASSSPPQIKATRPLCPYPKVVKYKGTGEGSNAASFVCSAPKK